MAQVCPLEANAPAGQVKDNLCGSVVADNVSLWKRILKIALPQHDTTNCVQ